MSDALYARQAKVDRRHAPTPVNTSTSSRVHRAADPTRLPVWAQAWGLQPPPSLRLPTLQRASELHTHDEPPNQTGISMPVLRKMESFWGQDFSAVRVHTNSALASQVRALAYTQGNELHFAPGQFQPQTTRGQELLGHELTHVVQQREGRVRPLLLLDNGMYANDDSTLEREAAVLGAEAARQGEQTRGSDEPQMDSVSPSTAVHRKMPTSDAPLEAMPQKKGAFAEKIQQAAREGIHTSASTLPFIERIRQSFAQHEISQVQAHLGSQATESAAAMHAAAYTTGNHVVFAGRPDLHTVAHEATHLVQQQHSVQLAGSIAKAGDLYEQHADAVADRVVAGQSAEDLLSGFTREQREIHHSKSLSINNGEVVQKAPLPTGKRSVRDEPEYREERRRPFLSDR